MTDLRAICITERLYVVSVANEKGIAANDRRIPKKSIYEENDRKLGHSEKKLNFTQIELAKRIGVSRQTLMDIENQKTFEQVWRYCESFLILQLPPTRG